MAMWNGHDEEDTETHGAIHTREAYEKLSIVYEKVREGCHYDVSCVRRYHFIRDVFIPIHLKLHNSSRRQSTHCGNPSELHRVQKATTRNLVSAHRRNRGVKKLPENRNSKPSREEEATTKMAIQSPHKLLRFFSSQIHCKLHN